MADLEAATRGKTATPYPAPKDVSDKVLCDMIFNYQIAHTQREMNREQHCARLLKLARLAEELEADEWRFRPVEKLLGFSNQS
ncbi:anaphase-promoting complex subunit 16 [Petromyzon marinus]|uniref:Anaphase-promoting complex subunit 16 n=1 Tax=Petromyzon marinus TaxID=7757 RepID=A0AAJ7SWX8_PETMA|nr:anaphase-promoting complex subunit 16 [Petromyzon marinus]